MSELSICQTKKWKECRNFSSSRPSHIFDHSLFLVIGYIFHYQSCLYVWPKMYNFSPISRPSQMFDHSLSIVIKYISKFHYYPYVWLKREKCSFFFPFSDHLKCCTICHLFSFDTYFNTRIVHKFPHKKRKKMFQCFHFSTISNSDWVQVSITLHCLMLYSRFVT